MPRARRIVEIDWPHHLTQRGNNKQKVFHDVEDYETYLEILMKQSNKYAMRIDAYCLMPNHVHLVSIPRQEDSLAKGFGLTNQIYSQYYCKKYKTSGHLWQSRFFSAPMDWDYYWQVMTYIELNPVKTGIVSSAEDYPWSSAAVHSSGVTSDPILNLSLWQEQVNAESWKQTLDKGLSKSESETVRKGLTSSFPIGSKEFVDKLEKKHDMRLRPQKRGRKPKRSRRN